MITDKKMLDKYVIIRKDVDENNPGYSFYKAYSVTGNMFDRSLGIGLYTKYENAVDVLQLSFDAAHYILSIYKELDKAKSDLVWHVTPGDFNDNIKDTLIVSDLVYTMCQSALDENGYVIKDDSYQYIMEHSGLKVMKLSEVINKFTIYEHDFCLIADPVMDGLKYKSFKD